MDQSSADNRSGWYVVGVHFCLFSNLLISYDFEQNFFCYIIITQNYYWINLKAITLPFLFSLFFPVRKYIKVKIGKGEIILNNISYIRGQITNICWIIINKRIPEKHLLFHLYTKTFDCVDPCLTVWITGSTVENYETDYLTCLLKTCIQVKKQQLEQDMEQMTGSKLEKELYIVTLLN